MSGPHGGRRERARLRVVNGMEVPELRGRLEQKLQSTTDLQVITPTVLKQWKLPPFQRPLRVNKAVLEVSAQIQKDDGIIPGMLTIGVLHGEMWVVDGQHRLHGLRLAMDNGVKEGLAEIRVCYFESMAEMAEEFVRLNRSLVQMRPDDVLRGMEGTIDALARLRKLCPAIGYDNIRRGPTSPVLSMAAVLRIWKAASMDTPATSGGASLALAQSMTMDDAKTWATFLNLCVEAWGFDAEYRRLYANLNLAICGWLYFHLVLGRGVNPGSRVAKLTHEQFSACLMALSANTKYLDWLVGRNLTERDRSPAYMRVRTIFVRRLVELTGKKVNMPAPEWASNSGRQQPV